jgi:hypothetical protein
MRTPASPALPERGSACRGVYEGAVRSKLRAFEVRCHHDQADDTPLSVPLRCSLVALSPRQTGAPVRNRDTNSLLRWEARAFAHCHVARQWRCDPSLPGNSDAASSSQPLSLNGPFPGAVRLPGAGRNPTHHAPATLDRTYFQVAVSCVPVIHRSQVIPALPSFSRHYFQVAVSRCVVTRLSQVMSSLLQAVLRSLLPGGGVALRRCLAVPGHLGSPSVVTISTSRCHACQSPTDPRSSRCSFSRRYFQVAVSRCVVIRLSQVISVLLPSVVATSRWRCRACQSSTSPRSFRHSSGAAVVFSGSRCRGGASPRSSFGSFLECREIVSGRIGCASEPARDPHRGLVPMKCMKHRCVSEFTIRCNQDHASSSVFARRYLAYAYIRSSFPPCQEPPRAPG